MRAILGFLGAACLVMCACTLAAWSVGRILSDRWVWSQYLAWMPTVVVAPSAAVVWGMGSVLVALGRKSTTRRGRWITGGLVGATAVWVLVAVGYLLGIECRVYRLPRPERPTGPHLRVLNWNVTAVERLAQITEPVKRENPDIALLVNPHSHVGWSQVPAEFPGYRYLNVGGIVVLSRVPVVRYGMEWLGLGGAPPDLDPESGRRPEWTDPGRAMFVEFDTTAQLGRRTAFWIVDMPSEPRLSRWKMCSDAAAAIRAWARIPAVPDDQDGQAEQFQEPGFPKPDVVLGDFNTPRGSASLLLLAPGMKNAFDEVGAGYSATWPRYGYRTPIPLLQLDQIFLGAGVKAARYEVVDPGFGYHQMQVGDLVAAK